ncbi:hypothetical protein [Roseateles sp. MS654]|uniref:hypothetical protein n=1 Tax=Roseateles sp. MS654 TaxID=3412685 RepID=UPI003C309E49
MSFATRLARQLGLNRVSVDTPLSQDQRTPLLPSTAIRPLDALPARPGPEGSSAPRAALPVQPHERPAATADSPDPAASNPPPGGVVLDAMRSPAPDLAALASALIQRDGQPPDAVASLAAELSRLDLSSVPPVPELPSAPVVLVAQSLAAACGGDARLAQDALDALAELDAEAELIASWQGAGRPTAASPWLSPSPSPSAALLSSPARLSDAGRRRRQDALRNNRAGWGAMLIEHAAADEQAARQAAWRTASALGGTPAGMDVLMAVTARPIDPARRRDFALLLKASEGAPRSLGHEGDPTALLRDPAARESLSGEAVACAVARMAGDLAAAEPHRWALAAVRNDLHETGPGTPFAALDARLMKMGRWIERAAPKGALRLRNPMLGKSPFRALRHGLQGVERGPAATRHRPARERALTEAAQALREGLLAQSPPRSGDGDADEAQSPPLSRGLLRAAVLAHCVDTASAASFERLGFDADARTAIADRLARWMLSERAASDPPVVSALARRVGELPELQALGALRLDAAMLGQWLNEARAGDAGRAASEPAAAALASAASALKRAHDEAQGRDTRIKSVDRETLRSALKDIVAHIEGSSRLRLTGGGIAGVGLRQVTASISAVASALFVRGRLDARAQHGRHAVFEIAMPPYDMEIVLGTQRQSTQQLGVGAAVGPDLGIAKLGLNVDSLLYGRDRSDLAGLSLRLPHVGRPQAELRAEFSRLVDRLIDHSAHGAAASDAAALSERGEPLLRQLLQEFPELTVNRIGDAGDSRRRHGIGADVTGSLGKWMLKATASAGAYVDAQRDVTRRYGDASGAMRVERTIDGSSTRATFALRGALGVSKTVAGSVGDAGKADAALGALQAGIGVDRILGGAFERREAVYEDGRLHPLSFVETEYQDLDQFAARMRPQLDAWVAAGVDRQRLERLIADIQRHASPNHSAAARFIVRPDMRLRDDAYRSALALCQRQAGGMPAEAAALERAIEAQWRDPAAMQPYSVRSYERNAAQRTFGLDLVVQVGSVTAAEASHIDARLDVPAR